MASGKVVAVVGVLALAGATVFSPAAEAHGRRVIVRAGFGFAPFGFGWGYGPFFAPYWAYGPYYAPPGGVDMNVAMMAGFGAVELNVKPDRADVWVDGKYVAEARDLDGDPSYLWLEKGPHHIAVYKGGYKTFEDDIDVTRGVKRELKLRLEPGDSLPPGPKPGDKDPDRSKSKERPRGSGGDVD